MLRSILVLSVFSAISAFADTTTFKVEGMTCAACVKNVKAAVCGKMEGVEKCDVQVGSVTLTTKKGVSIDAKKVEDLITSDGQYKVISKK